MQTPALIIIFNRPEVTAKVAEAIAKAKPPLVFVFADGPRTDRPGEAEKCAATRAAIDRIDWPCDVLKNYSDVNLGCGRGVTSGIDWVFHQTDRAMIFEDDCLPDPSFFPFCDELLERYRDDERIMQIAGCNLQCGHRRGAHSYFFSRFNTCWGWATWRRAWNHMDLSMKKWSAYRHTSWVLDRVGDAAAARYLSQKFEDAYRAGGRIDYFDYPWMFATWVQNGLCIVPNVNLVSNIGFGDHATHTKWSESRWANLARTGMPFPLQHPPSIMRHQEADDFFVRQVVRGDIPKTDGVIRRGVKTAREAYAAAIPKPTRMFLRKLRGRT
jgi:hypothetical protein